MNRPPRHFTGTSQIQERIESAIMNRQNERTIAPSILLACITASVVRHLTRQAASTCDCIPDHNHGPRFALFRSWHRQDDVTKSAGIICFDFPQQEVGDARLYVHFTPEG